MYVPVAGRIAPATARNRVGPLPARFPIVGGPVRARAGGLQRRGASCSCHVPVAPLQSRQLGEGKTGPSLRKIARSRLHLQPELGRESRNPAYRTVRPLALYLQSYSLFSVLAVILYLFVYVPVAGHIAPASARNRVGLLPARFPIVGSPVGARAGRLQGRGASCACHVPAAPVQSWQVCEGKTGPSLRRIARGRIHLRLELGLASRNTAYQTVRPSAIYL